MNSFTILSVIFFFFLQNAEAMSSEEKEEMTAACKKPGAQVYYWKGKKTPCPSNKTKALLEMLFKNDTIVDDLVNSFIYNVFGNASLFEDEDKISLRNESQEYA